MIRLILIIVVLSLLPSRPVFASKRIALLIGNEAYAREVGPLKNPINDIELIGRSLAKIGFEQSDIHFVRNGTRKDILLAVDRHARALRAAGAGAISFVYYSGHGAANQENRRNFLIPVEVSRLDQDVWYDAVPLDRIVTTLSNLAREAAHFVIFDACRNVLNMPTKGGKGFVPVSTRRGMLIAFSTDPGQTASDEGLAGGPYAAALASELAKPGVHHLDLFQNVKETVYQKTRGQVPWTRNGMLERIYLGGKRNQQEFAEEEQRRAEQAKRLADRKAALLRQTEEFRKARDEAERARRALRAAEEERIKALKEVEDARRTRLRIERSANDAGHTQIASLPPSVSPSLVDQASDYAREAQQRLKILGCYSGPIDGVWGGRSRAALARALGAQSTSAPPNVDTIKVLRKMPRDRCVENKPKTAENKQLTSPQKRAVVRKKSSSNRCEVTHMYGTKQIDCQGGCASAPRFLGKNAVQGCREL